MKVVLAIAALLPLVGCASMSHETKVEEAVFQSVATIDAAQTEVIAHHPVQFSERGLYGLGREHPSPTDVAVVAAGMQALHFGVTYELSREGVPQELIRLWQGVTIAGSTFSVIHNHTLGIRIERRF
jgi:hypothetical protein